MYNSHDSLSGIAFGVKIALKLHLLLALHLLKKHWSHTHPCAPLVSGQVVAPPLDGLNLIRTLSDGSQIIGPTHRAAGRHTDVETTDTTKSYLSLIV